MQCADGYSGCGGVTSNGSQPGSAITAGLTVLAALRIAVIGRHVFWAYFTLNAATVASASAMYSSAKRRACSSSERFLICAAARAAAFRMGTSLADQKIAAAVWSAVRVVLSRAPRLLTSFRSRANSALSSAGRLLA